MFPILTIWKASPGSRFCSPFDFRHQQRQSRRHTELLYSSASDTVSLCPNRLPTGFSDSPLISCLLILLLPLLLSLLALLLSPGSPSSPFAEIQMTPSPSRGSRKITCKGQWKQRKVRECTRRKPKPILLNEAVEKRGLITDILFLTKYDLYVEVKAELECAWPWTWSRSLTRKWKWTWTWNRNRIRADHLSEIYNHRPRLSFRATPIADTGSWSWSRQQKQDLSTSEEEEEKDQTLRFISVTTT